MNIQLLRATCFLLGFTIAACGSESQPRSSTPSAGPSPTATPIPTATPAAAAAVEGLLVLRNDVPSGPTDSVGVPPRSWQGIAIGEDFDRSLAHASVLVEGEGQSFILDTSADGSFRLPDLRPGKYRLLITKALNGNLVQTALPLPVGDRGITSLLVQVAWGQVRSVVRYERAGRIYEEIHTDKGLYLVRRDGQGIEFSDGGRTWSDTDADGTFDPESCDANLWPCDFETGCEGSSSCVCTSSCPACDDCGPGVCSRTPIPYAYRCGEQGTCVNPTDRCVCVASCPECGDCPRQVCVPNCLPVQITDLSVTDSLELPIGQAISATATLSLSDGSRIDVTPLLDWNIDDVSVARVDPIGNIQGLAVGSAKVTARWDDRWTAQAPVRVVERPAVLRLTVINALCRCGPTWLSDPAVRPAELPCILHPQAPETSLPSPVPWCREVLRVGASLQFLALAELADGSVEDVTPLAEWSAEPANVAEVRAGEVVARQAGWAQISATFQGVRSDAVNLRVVERPTPIALYISADRAFPELARGSGGAEDGTPPTCVGCDYDVTFLIEERIQFRATAEYDTGEWQDVTESVEWQSSAPAAVGFLGAGLAIANAPGDAEVTALLEDLRSNTVRVRVVSEAAAVALWIQPEGNDRVLGRGGEMFFRATATYDLGMTRDVTESASWRSNDETVARFAANGRLAGLSAGTVQVWAEFSGLRSEPVTIEVYETFDLAYCDPANVNHAVWTDGFNRVVLESDCARYDVPGLVTLRYTVTETQPRGGVFDPCLDLYVFRGAELIRTLREEGCGAPFLEASAPDRDREVLRYQTRAVWDLRDASGNLVSPGVYRIYGRFYLYYDPVVYLDVTVGTPSPTPTPPGPADRTSGCFLGSCSGGLLAELQSRDACCAYARTNLTPLGVSWCDWMVGGVCAAGACRENPCEDEPSCCPPNARCLPHIPPCKVPECCPPGALCGPLNLPECPEKCCPDGLLCIPELPPCSPAPGLCGGIAGFPCPDGFVCNMEDPTCSIADLAGSCTPRPRACPLFYSPVCGCDGITYGNDCERLTAAVTLRHRGPCETAE